MATSASQRRLAAFLALLVLLTTPENVQGALEGRPRKTKLGELSLQTRTARSLAGSVKMSSIAQTGKASCLAAHGLTQVAFQDAKTKTYLGSPAIVMLPDGTLLTSHSHFQGPGRTPALTSVTASRDGGATWRPLASVQPMHWAALFTYRGNIFLLGTNDNGLDAKVVISRSIDEGATWSDPVTLFTPPRGCTYATGAVVVLEADGFLYRSLEYYCGELRWPQSYQALVIYAREGSNLLLPESWEATDPVPFTRDMLPDWMPGPVVSGGFLEGNMVQAPAGGVALMMRCRVYDAAGRTYTLQHACLLRLVGSAAARNARLAWGGFIDMPGGGNKFIIKYDAPSGRYLALTNPSVDRYGSNSDARNVLVLVQSTNLLDWRIVKTLLRPDPGAAWEASLWGESYQYVDWVTDGGDLLTTIRTACDGANSFHNSNRITFKRWKGFREWLTGAGGLASKRRRAQEGDHDSAQRED